MLYEVITEIPAFRPYFVSAAIWHGLDVSEDGTLVTAYTGDGRKYLFYDSEMKEPGDGESEWYSGEWQSNVTVPEELEGSIIYTYGENAKIAAENEILYLTGATLPAYYPRITSYNVCYTKLLRIPRKQEKHHHSGLSRESVYLDGHLHDRMQEVYRYVQYLFVLHRQ